MNRLDPLRTGMAAALTAAAVSVVCAIAVNLSPQGTMEFVNSWTHGLDLTLIRSDRPMTPGSVALGVINVALTGFALGVVFSWARNLVGWGRGGKGA